MRRLAGLFSRLFAGRGGRGNAWLLESLSPLPASWQGQREASRPSHPVLADPQFLQDFNREVSRFFGFSTPARGGAPAAVASSATAAGCSSSTVNWQFADKR